MACELDNDDDNVDEDDVNLNDPASLANSAIDGAEGRSTSRSTNEPLKKIRVSPGKDRPMKNLI